MDRRSGNRSRAERPGMWATGLVTLLAIAAFLLSAAALGAQDRQRLEECRCVDADGNEIENCSCLRSMAPNFTLFNAVGGWGARARIGVTVASGQSRRYDDAGAYVQDVLRDGPADEAGLREGDLITAFQGRSLLDPLPDMEDEEDLNPDLSLPVQRLLALLEDVEPDEEVEVEYVRDGRTRTATLTAEENNLWSFRVDAPNITGMVYAPDERVRNRIRVLTDSVRDRVRGEALVLSNPRGAYDFRVFSDTLGRADFETLMVGRMDPCYEGDRGFLALSGRCVDGIEMEMMNPELGEYFGAESGLLVTEVHEGATLGLRPGDVLLAIDGREVQDFDHVRRVLRSYERDEDLTLRILRKGEEMEITGRRR